MPVITAKTITKGLFYRVVAGDGTLLATAVSTELGVFVALETKVVATADLPATVQVTAAKKVVVATGGVIKPNGYAIIETGSAEIIAGDAADFAAGLVVGRYRKVPGADVLADAADAGLGILDLGAP
jgi:hypothetical protein